MEFLQSIFSNDLYFKIFITILVSLVLIISIIALRLSAKSCSISKENIFPIVRGIEGKLSILRDATTELQITSCRILELLKNINLQTFINSAEQEKPKDESTNILKPEEIVEEQKIDLSKTQNDNTNIARNYSLFKKELLEYIDKMDVVLGMDVFNFINNLYINSFGITISYSTILRRLKRFYPDHIADSRWKWDHEYFYTEEGNEFIRYLHGSFFC